MATHCTRKTLTVEVTMKFYISQQQKKASVQTQYWTQMVLDEHENKSCPSHYQYGCLFRGANDQVQPIPQPVYHTCPTPYWKESLSGVQMIKSSRYLNRSITPAQPFLKRNLYQGCKWSSPADTSTGLSHLPNPFLKEISIRGANDQVQPIPQPVYHTCPTPYWKESLSGVQMIKSSRYLNRSITPA